MTGYGIASACVVLLSSPASADSLAPSFDCAKAQSDVDEAICASDALASLDLELARLYRLATRGPHATADRVKALKQSQRDWLRERSECWKASIGLETCVANAYAFRIHALREGNSDARSDDSNGASLGPVAYRCDGLDALVGAVFVNTREPLVSLSWLTFGIVLPRVESGSGVKYASDLWDSSPSLFWTRGDTATFAPPGGAEVQCRREPIG
jgi:uncharacterized protein